MCTACGAAATGGGDRGSNSHRTTLLASPSRHLQIVSVKGDDDADFAFEAAQVTAGSFRLQYGDETTDCIGYAMPVVSAPSLHVRIVLDKILVISSEVRYYDATTKL